MRKLAIAFVAAAAVVASGSFFTRANALPMFARKYHMECAGCHDNLVFPRLNDVGYKFRRAGFRMPENIGKDELSDFTVSDYFSAAAQATYSVTHDDSGTLNGFALDEVSLRPITGSFQKYFASQVELSVTTDGIEVENAYVRAVYGNQDTWLSARFGVFHAVEGYGAMDRPIGLSAPLFEMMSPNNGQDTLTMVIGHNRVGADVGVMVNNTSVSLEVLNRMTTDVTPDGMIGTEGTGAAAENGKDLLLIVNQIIDGHTGLGAYWDHGRVPLPLDPAAFVAGTNTATWSAAFDRFALFASAGTSKFTVLAGGELAIDSSLDPATGGRKRFDAMGGFVEGDVATGAYGAAFLRLDYYDPSLDIDKNQVVEATAGARLYQNWISIVPELQVMQTAVGDASTTSESFIVAAQAIY
jgi:hypothetical protein